MELDYKAIGKRIKIARINTDMTQEALADRIGLSPSHMSNIETGSTRVSLTTIVNLANALGVTVDDLLCDNLAHARPQLEGDIWETLAGCGEDELRLVKEVSRSLLEAVRRNKRLRDE
ncbi:MAG: helix-turn-helix domain-containing protein [Oscillospiraceae bacterium]|nr:helix-turn-helix domain-containing protein [Oscillospiraceae bacterium]